MNSNSIDSAIDTPAAPLPYLGSGHNEHTDTRTFSERKKLFFAPVANRLLDALADADAQNAISETLTDNIASLQDHFIEKLYTAFNLAQVDLSHKITLRLNAGQPLIVLGEHPDREQVNELLVSHPELTDIFEEIAAQSSALRELGSLYRLASHARHCKGVPEGFPAYQISLKGDMSHFFFLT